jgi:hypothetical protein
LDYSYWGKGAVGVNVAVGVAAVPKECTLDLTFWFENTVAVAAVAVTDGVATTDVAVVEPHSPFRNIVVVAAVVDLAC